MSFLGDGDRAKSLKHFVMYWVPVILYACLIFYVSSQSRLPDLRIMRFRHFDKVVHFTEYAIFSVLIFRAAVNSPRSLLNKRAFMWAILIASIYGMSDEIHQFFVPYRFCDFWDWAVDTLGAASAQYAIFVRQAYLK